MPETEHGIQTEAPVTSDIIEESVASDRVEPGHRESMEHTPDKPTHSLLAGKLLAAEYVRGRGNSYNRHGLIRGTDG